MRRTPCSSSKWAHATTATSPRWSRSRGPTSAILTNVGEAHLEIVGSRERLEETKWATLCRRARAPSSMPPMRFRAVVPRTLERRSALVRCRAGRPNAGEALDPLTAFDGDRRLVHRADGATIQLAVDVAYPDRTTSRISPRQSPGRSSSAFRSQADSRRSRRFAYREGRYDRIALRRRHSADLRRVQRQRERHDRSARRLRRRVGGSPHRRARSRWPSSARSRARCTSASARTRRSESTCCLVSGEYADGSCTRRAARWSRRRADRSDCDERAGGALAARARSRRRRRAC